MEKNPLNILIVGSYGVSNLGDEVLLEELIKHLPQKSIKNVLTANSKDTMQRHPSVNEASIHFPFGIRSLFSFQWIKSIQLLKKSDLVLFGGGGLLTDHRTLKAVALWSWQAFCIGLFNKPLILVGNSVGPFRTKLGRKLAEGVLNQAESVWLRDEQSFETCKKITKSAKLHLGADLAFLYPRLQKTQTKSLAINLRPWISSTNLRPLIEHYLQKGYKVILIPMEHQDEKLLSTLRREGVELKAPKSFSEVVELLSECEFALGMRLHFLIAASLAGTKLAGISYSNKVSGLLDQIKVPHLAPEESASSFIKLLQESKKAHHLDEQFNRAKKMMKEINPSS